MKRFFISLFALCCVTALSASSVNYTADNTTIFANPERGFITMLEGHLSDSKPYAVKGNESEFSKHISRDKGSIILILYYLENYRTTATLPSKIINAFDEDMQVLRDNGLKAIIRYAYTNDTYKSGGVESAQDASLDIVKSHIAQLSPKWKANADVIFVFQAGIVGAWGEWYYSDNFGNQSSHMNASRRELVDTLLSAIPSDRMLQLRTPLFKTEYLNDTKALTATEAYTGTPKARLGQHNDAFLYDYDNMGTYSDTAKQKPWLAQETLYVPIGGETDITEDDLAELWATQEKTVAEMSRLHWTFIQSGYSTTVTNRWRNNGTFDILNRQLGYRYQLVSGTYADQVQQGEKLSVNIRLKNVGFAPLYNERPAYLVLKNGSTTKKIKLATDPRTWLPNGVQTTINEQVTIPNSVPTGTYQLYLYLPDAYSSLASDPKYAVRFANSSVWDSSTGMNSLNASVTVTQGSGTPDPIDPGDAIQLPATLNKANVDTYSADMTWYNTDYFDFGPDDDPNLDRYAQWQVYLKYPGNYLVSAYGDYPNGHQWQIELLDSGLDPFALTKTWDQGSYTENGAAPWNLSSVAPGVYTLRLTNIFEWSQPKIQSLTLDYDGELPPDTTGIEEVESDEQISGRKIIVNGRLYIIRGNRVYDATGRRIE